MTDNPPLPPHSTRFGYIEVSLTRQKLKTSWGRILDELKEEIEPIVINSGYLEGAPFSWVGLAVRYGLRYDKEPTYERIDKKYGDLPLGMEIDVRDIVEADDESVRKILKRMSLTALIHAGEKYDRPTLELRRMLKNAEKEESADI